ncbi:glutathione S-transferase family protein [Seongchinamella sediminis]|uniref:Glutathione S-transferase family protein n=1 Tax=Seongchinamella sediminis TaxID=2283635 RepID=A0A3L7DXI9_9GAMM|nr:glutathione S-transferase family protein [Seongchinamella sediminis]RLQ21309.1 glutathione S-transferase family protein [Seongchinamella sediminis]
MKLWHCAGARSLRPLWALEEMGLEYELEIVPFPPRVLQKDYLEVNSLGTVPYFVDGDTQMTESSAICQYLVDRYQQYDLGLSPQHPEYGAYLNWLHHADATLTFPQTISMRYYYLEPTPEKQAVADDYARWFVARLRRLDEHLLEHEYLVDKRFTIADIAIGYALYLSRALQLDEHIKPQTRAYLERVTARPAFARADAMGEPLQLPERG